MTTDTARNVARRNAVPGASRPFSPAVSEALDAIQLALCDLDDAATDPAEYARALAALQAQVAGKLAALL